MTERLLTRKDINIDEEIRNVELLKLRFGDHSLHKCDVMIKDIRDSQRFSEKFRED